MALIQKLKSLGSDTTGRILTVYDNTGLYDSNSNSNGYNSGINPDWNDFEFILFTIREYDSKKTNYVRYVKVADHSHPEYLTSPSIKEITEGAHIDITSISLNLNSPEEGLKTFKDGIYDINMYTAINDINNVNIEVEVGLNYLIDIDNTNQFQRIFDTYNNIIINNDIYTIDKSKSDELSNKLYLKEVITSSGYVYSIYRANCKLYNSATSDCSIVESTGNLALLDSCKCSCGESDEETYFRLLMYKTVSKINYNSRDYKESNDLLKAAERGSKSLKCNCK